MLQESCLRLYDLLKNEKETAGGVDRGDHKEDHSGRCMVEGGVGTASAYG